VFHLEGLSDFTTILPFMKGCGLQEYSIPSGGVTSINSIDAELLPGGIEPVSNAGETVRVAV